MSMPHSRSMFECAPRHVTTADESRFILNGLRHANTVLGKTAFVEGEWKVIGEYVYDVEGGRHQAFYSPLRETTVMGELIRPHDRIFIEQSLKYSPVEATELWKHAGMAEINQWKCGDEYGELIYTMDGGVLRHTFSSYPYMFPMHTPRFPGRWASHTIRV